MSLNVTWTDIGARLLLTLIAGTIIGINRTERGRPAGLRTTILVCLAASVSMIQANLLMPTTGKTPDSFVVLDLMRLPLGILTGMGFIGAGAILRRGDIVQGVTTAATLWLVTIIGLCFGGGQIELGVAAVALAFLVLWGLRPLEQAFYRDRLATLVLCATEGGPDEEFIRATLLAAGFQIAAWSIAYRFKGSIHRREIRCTVRWHGKVNDTQTPPFLAKLKEHPGLLTVRWSE